MDLAAFHIFLHSSSEFSGLTGACEMRVLLVAEITSPASSERVAEAEQYSCEQHNVLS